MHSEYAKFAGLAGVDKFNQMFGEKLEMSGEAQNNSCTDMLISLDFFNPMYQYFKMNQNNFTQGGGGWERGLH